MQLQGKNNEIEMIKNNNKKREDYIIKFFSEKNAEVIKKMESDINKKIEELKNDVMNYINN